ncbi:hypothetical protein B0H13DRAFT_2501759 [Mycena leptocephala]|nr:hypothetical protein B0H13DRAFT_2501759 [Mycena leptocephala]
MSDLSQYKTCAIAIPDSEKNSNVSNETIVGAIGSTQASSAAHAVVTKLDQLWDSGATVTYSYSGGTANQQAKVDKVVLEWFPYANLTFQRTTVGTLRISFDPKLGSWSYVGKVNQSVASPAVTMNLGWVADNTTVSDDDRGVILHEFGHALGLLHEHQSPARNGTLNLDEDAVYAYYAATQGWDKATIKAQIIDVYNATDVSNYSALDLTSIMMYFMPAAMNEQHKDVPPNYKLSDMDKAYMIINYPRPTPHALAPEWTLDHALQVSGVDPATTQDIKNAKGDATPSNSVEPPSPNGTPAPANGVNSDPNGTTTNTNTGTNTNDPVNGPALPWTNGAESLCRRKVQPRRTMYNMAWLWNGCYGFHYRKQRVRTALALYMQHTSIKFQEVNIKGFDFENIIARPLCKIRIGFGPVQNNSDGSVLWGWAKVGKSAVDSAFNGDMGYPGKKWSTIYLGGQALKSDAELTAADLAMSNATVYHELGHVLGLRHEHASPNSNIVNGGSISDFDPSSVMLYKDLPYKNSGATSALNVMPSNTDLDLLRLLYPDNGLPNGMFARALDAFTFNATDKKRLLDRAVAAVGDGTNVKSALVGEMWADIALNLNANPRLSQGALSSVTPPGPLNDLAGPAAAAEAPTYQAPGFLYELVNALKQFFNPGGNQIFTLQFPGRFLDQGSYAWDTSVAGVYSSFVKPSVVNEAEFRLVDQLYDLAPNVAGPNGTNLSIVYEQVLQFSIRVDWIAESRDQIRAWLMKDVPMSQWISNIMARQQAREQALADAVAVSMGTNDYALAPTPANALAPGIIELLMNEYLYAKQDWEVERDGLISQASQADLGTPESQKALNDLTRKLAHITATRQAQLAAKYSDAVVRGYAHTVREYMGYLDIASPAEALQNAKDSLREAAMSSLDGLSTSFTMEDLTQDPEVIRMQIDAKSQQLDTLNTQLVALQMGTTGDPTDLEKKVAAAQTSLDAAQSALSQAYSNNVIEMANTCLDAAGKVDTSTLAGKLKMAQSALANLPAMMDKVKAAQDNLTASSRALSQMMSALALAQATDTKQQQQQLTLQIQSRCASCPVDNSGVPLLISSSRNKPLPAGAGGRLFNSQAARQLARLLRAPTQRLRPSSGLAIYGSHPARVVRRALRGLHEYSTASTDTMDLAFRATLVTVDRGGWFQPQFFKESKAFYKVNNDVSWIDSADNTVHGLMPGFPVAFLVCKDIVIRVTHDASSSSDQKAVDSKSAASSGGFLCFSFSQSSSSSSSATSSNFQAYSNGYIIKIPGPQILGYMIQKTDSDEAQLMPAELPADFFIPDDEYNKTVDGTQPSNGVNPTPASDVNTGKSTVSPTMTQEKMQEVLAKMLNDKVAELFSTTPAANAPVAGSSGKA